VDSQRSKQAESSGARADGKVLSDTAAVRLETMNVGTRNASPRLHSEDRVKRVSKQPRTRQSV